ncbi:hypothetical protein E2C01_064934 [Portunus trituberculatus]|uniref:Uncharacterized protein n=1 Tax=Portunus trituberculatus TaxID=210409 RepID=A0A5B7HLP3_PORTR|nr:hypothetical protein [Portunus trituberculatus]
MWRLSQKSVIVHAAVMCRPFFFLFTSLPAPQCQLGERGSFEPLNTRSIPRPPHYHASIHLSETQLPFPHIYRQRLVTEMPRPGHTLPGDTCPTPPYTSMVLTLSASLMGGLLTALRNQCANKDESASIH